MVKLTDIQADMLLHRLDADDCIVAAFLDTHEDDPPSAYKEAEIVDAIARLAEMVQSRTLPDHLEGVMADVLAECIEGSAWWGGADHEARSEQQLSSWMRSGYSLEHKVSKIVGRTVSFPAYS